METLRKRLPGSLCLICGVDSGPIRTFILVFMGGLVASAFCIWSWAWLSGRLTSQEKVTNVPLEVEKEHHDAE